MLPDPATTAACWPRAGIATLLPALQAALREPVLTSPAARAHYGHGEALPDDAPPDAVVRPRDNGEVAAVARLCHEARVPLIPFGAGTSVEGQVVAIQGGVTMDLSLMDAILDVSPAALDCRVQAGVRRLRLNEALRGDGLFFPVDPGADATLGGMAATRASGTGAVRYGTMRENVLGLTVVTADGRILRTGTRARKSASGYDLTRLFLGSEGTLGIITEVQLRLQGLPEAVSAATCQFPSVEAALEVAVGVLQSGIPVARMEFANAPQMRCCIAFSRLEGLEALPTLFLEFHGSPAAVEEQALAVEALATGAGGGGFAWARRPEDRSRLWKARHDALPANLAHGRGRALMGTDACVPISELAACILEMEADIAATGLEAPLIGHVGDGNFHLGILFDAAVPGERERAQTLAHRTGERAIRLGGTCSGEHGIGLHKLDLMAKEHGGALDLMWAIKRAFDPYGIMNPGKLLPPCDGA